MAQIIDFTSFRNARPARINSASEGAELLFFLGVRYERMPETPAPDPAATPASGGRRGRKRRA